MNLMKTSYRTILGALFLLFPLAGCTGNDVPIPEPEVEKEDMPICWNVQSASLEDGRALIEDDAALQTACTGGNKAIGIWSAYRLNGDSVKNVLGMDGDVSLVYNPSTAWDNWEGWTYGEKAAYWMRKAVYYFNAYFPKTGGLTSIANDSTSLKGTYNTETTQTDLMVSRVKVDTNGNFEGSPVPLPMKHALATLKFIFRMDGGTATELLKSFSLDNTLKTSATLNYNTDFLTIGNWTNGVSSNDTRIYEWSDNNGISFSTEMDAVPYTTGESFYRTDDGHIFIIPQKCEVTPTFNCTMGINSFENIPLGTTQFDPGKNYIYTIKVEDKTVDVTLTIKPWNEKNSSYDIDF